MRYFFAVILLFLFSAQSLIAQPEPCGASPTMYSSCVNACVICDIDGFTGRNNLQGGAPGPEPPNFCSFPNDMHWIAFIAGSTSLSIRIDVFNCIMMGNEQSLDLGFYESMDCQNFTPITECRMDLDGGDSHVFETDVPLVIGQHYYLVMDGSSGSICEWSFTVEEGTTQVSPIDNSGQIVLPDETCPNFPTVISNSGVTGAALYFWTIDGAAISNTAQQFSYSFADEGKYEICVRAANVCDEGPPVCDSIFVREIETLEINEVLCDGDCITANGVDFCTTGVFQEVVILPNGCDSIININLEILPQPLTDLDLWICNDETYFIGTEGYNETGSYSGIVLTENECDSIVNLELLVIECEILGTTEDIDVLCNGGATGTLIFSVDQGTPPLEYTYVNTEDPSITGMGSTNLLINNEINGLPAGPYQIYIKDEFDNDVVVRDTVREPLVLALSLDPSDYNGFNVSCNRYFDASINMMIDGNDGSLTANPVGGVPPYTYQWSDNQDSQTAIGLNAMNFEVTVTDNSGCTTTSNYTLESPSLIEPIVEFIDPSCAGFDTGIVDVTNITGGIGPYQIALNSTNQFGTDSTFQDLFEGVYEIFVVDDNNCLSWVSGEITAPDIPVIDLADELEIDLGDSIQINTILNDIDIQSIEWNDASTLNCEDCLEPVSYAVNNTSYDLTITSVDDCVDMESISVKVNKIRPVYFPNVFSPNKDGVNEVFTVYTNRATEMVEELNIFDRWGNLIFSQTDFDSNVEQLGWDGKFKGEKVDPGVYVYLAKLLFIDGVSLPYTGTISVTN